MSKAEAPTHSHSARGPARGFGHWAISTLLAITSSLYRVCSLCSPFFLRTKSHGSRSFSREGLGIVALHTTHSASFMVPKPRTFKKSKHQKQEFTNTSIRNNTVFKFWTYSRIELNPENMATLQRLAGDVISSCRPSISWSCPIPSRRSWWQGRWYFRIPASAWWMRRPLVVLRFRTLWKLRES